MTRTAELEMQASEQRRAQTAKLQHWEQELRALAEQLWNEDSQNGWSVRYIAEPYMHALVTIDGEKFARFERDKAGIVGVFGDGQPERFASREVAFDEAVKRRMHRI